MIRDQGVETLRGHHREAVFDAVAAKANWPTAAGVRIGPEEDLLVAGGRVLAELHLFGLPLTVSGEVTEFEPGACIEATGSQGGISATMLVRFTDNADDPNRHDPVTSLRPAPHPSLQPRTNRPRRVLGHRDRIGNRKGHPGAVQEADPQPRVRAVESE